MFYIYIYIFIYIYIYIYVYAVRKRRKKLVSLTGNQFYINDGDDITMHYRDLDF